jgi:hypothetical protein
LNLREGIDNTEDVAKVYDLWVRKSDFEKAQQDPVQQTAMNGDLPR